MGGRNWLDFSCRDRHWLDFCSAAENYLCLGSGSGNNSPFLAFCVRASSRLGIRVGIEIELISVVGSKLTWLLCGGSKPTWLWCGYRNWLDFCAGCRNWFCFCVWVDNHLFFLCGLKLRAKKYPILECWSIDLFFVWVVEIDLVSVCGPKITCFRCEHRTWLRFCEGGLTWLYFSVCIKVDSVFV